MLHATTLLFFMSLMLPVAPVEAAAEEAPQTEGAEACDVLAVIDETVITQSDLSARLARMEPPARAPYESPTGRRMLLREMVGLRLLAREAEAVGIQRDSEFLEALERVRRSLLARYYVQRHIVDPIEIDEEATKEYFSAHLEEFRIPERIEAASILVKISPKADEESIQEKRSLMQAVLDRLDRGADFIEVAEEVSESPFTVGPDIFGRGRFVPEVDEVVFELEGGDLSPVFELPDGLLLVKVFDTFPARYPELDEVRDRVVETLRGQRQRHAYQRKLELLSEKYGVEFDEQWKAVESQPISARRGAAPETEEAQPPPR